MLSYSLTLYYKEKAPYADEIPPVKRMLEKISSRWRIPVEIIEAAGLSEDEADRLKMEFRDIQPQVRGRIVTSKDRVLPLSKRKNLNLNNTPILGVRREGRYIDVYPHLSGTYYFGIKSFLEVFLKWGPGNYLQAKGLLEEPIIKILSENPSLLGGVMRYVGTEVDVESGKPDIVFKDVDDRVVVVEVETHADDFAVGQVSRAAAGYASKYGLDPKEVRKAIVYQSAKSSLKAAALSAGIELYRLELRRVV
ncbi:MAG: endonuclease NucS domain-containing protein [Nitrososphaerales archaeon]